MSLKERFTSLLKEAYKIPNKNILQILSVLNESKIILSSIFSKKENIDFILSQNILEYLKRFSVRPNLSIQMLILKLYIILLKNSNFYPSITTNNLKLSIDLINEIISIIEKFENLLGNDIYELKRYLLNFLKFIYINYKDELKERKDEIFEMINDIQNRFFSESYNKVIVKFNPILNGDLNLDINLINDILINAKNLNEQFEIINCIFNHNKIDYSKIKNSETLINYGKLFMKFITNEKYIFQTIENNNNNENNYKELFNGFKDDELKEKLLVNNNGNNIKEEESSKSYLKYNKLFNSLMFVCLHCFFEFLLFFFVLPKLNSITFYHIFWLLILFLFISFFLSLNLFVICLTNFFTFSFF